MNFTAQYIKTESGYMGQILEWTEVVTEGNNIEECRFMLKDAINEIVLAYRQLGKDIPTGSILFENIQIDSEYVSLKNRPY